MNYSDSIKAILLAAINDLSKTPEKYAVKPLLLTGNFLKNYITVNMNSGPAMVLPVIFSLTLKIRIPILNQMVNLPEDLTRSISMLCFLYLISVLLIF